MAILGMGLPGEQQCMDLRTWQDCGHARLPAGGSSRPIMHANTAEICRMDRFFMAMGA